MSKFDERVNQLVDDKIEEVTRLFQSRDSIVPEIDFRPVLDKLNNLHNLMADIKQEVRKIEKNPPAQQKKKKPKKKEPEEEGLPEDFDWTKLPIEGLRPLIGSDDDNLPQEYDPSANAGDTFWSVVKKWLGWRIPNDDLDYYWELYKSLKPYERPPFDWDDIWFILTHPKAAPSPDLLTLLHWMFNPKDGAEKFVENAWEAYNHIQQLKAQEQQNNSTTNNHIDESTTEVINNIENLSDDAEDLTRQVLEAITACCSTVNQKLDSIKRDIEEGGGPVIKQDSLLIKKKLQELDEIIDELRRELRRFSDFNSRAESRSREQWMDTRRG